ncbi:hypothetical protein AG1IA_10320 [Rhizoctonia solani AG-1 IA]|uniref:Uncharacterized protein n=1 Tax=Thanatephorus cucumeris (strain AG1-IA) TaxID=983506 RepID=L8WCG9_THACA|nr:hypothetical protein AG1IA_10320 [Rhizoctonia solani AG-1 IA]
MLVDGEWPDWLIDTYSSRPSDRKWLVLFSLIRFRPDRNIGGQHSTVLTPEGAVSSCLCIPAEEMFDTIGQLDSLPSQTGQCSPLYRLVGITRDTLDLSALLFSDVEGP